MKKFLKSTLVVTLVLGMLSGCGPKTASQTGENIVENTSGVGNNFEVMLDNRTEDTQYLYGTDDLSLVDTVSGKKITLEMSTEEIESITGAPAITDREYRIYDGVVVKYADEKAVALIVASGQFPGEEGKRYKTSRGVGLDSSFDDFKSAYGNEFNQSLESTDDSGEVSKIPANASRFFKKSGSKVEFLGTDVKEVASVGEPYYMQDFMFSNASGNVTTIKLSVENM